MGGHSIRHDCKTLKQVQGDMAVVVPFVPSPYGRGLGRGGSNKIPEQVRDDVSLSLRGVCAAHDVVISLNSNDFTFATVFLLCLWHPSPPWGRGCHAVTGEGLFLTSQLQDPETSSG